MPQLLIPATWPDRIEDLAGQPTHFTTQILKGMYAHKLIDIDRLNRHVDLLIRMTHPNNLDLVETFRQTHKYTNPKTAHIVEGDNYKVGDPISFVQKMRGKTILDFAPRTRVTKVENISITYHKEYYRTVQVGDRMHLEYDLRKGNVLGSLYQGEHVKVPLLQLNDLIKSLGFEKPEHFFWLYNGNLKGQLITWV